MNNPTPRRHLTATAHSLYARRFVVALQGNVSLRVGPQRFLVTPAGAHLGRLAPDELVVIDHTGAALDGGTPTSEAALHLAVYAARPDVHAVVHAHPTAAVALLLAGLDLAPPRLPDVVLTLGEVPTVPYIRTGSQALAEAVGEMARGHDALLLDRHGVVTVGSSLERAVDHLETVEHAADAVLRAARAGEVLALSADEVAALRSMARHR